MNIRINNKFKVILENLSPVDHENDYTIEDDIEKNKVMNLSFVVKIVKVQYSIGDVEFIFGDWI